MTTCKVRCSQQPCFLQGGILVLLALLGHDLALRKPPNINQEWKARCNRAVEWMGWWWRAHATESSASGRVKILGSPGQFVTKEVSIYKLTNNLAKCDHICCLKSCVETSVFPIQMPLSKFHSEGDAQLLSHTPSWNHRIRQMLSEKPAMNTCGHYQSNYLAAKLCF